MEVDLKISRAAGLIPADLIFVQVGSGYIAVSAFKEYEKRCGSSADSEGRASVKIK